MAVYTQHYFYDAFNFLRGQSSALDRWVALISEGDLWLQMFFIQSGFLITLLLIREQRKTGRIDIRAFYWRRILRVWPLFYTTLILAAIFFPSADRLHRPLSMLSFLLFCGNFDVMHYGIENLSIGITWSLCVEEQFYLFWPLLMAAVSLRRQFLVPALTFVACQIMRFDFFINGKAPWPELYWHTGSIMGDMALGGLLAFVASFRRNWLDALARLPRAVWALPWILLCVTAFWRDHLESLPYALAWERPMWGIAWVLIFIEHCYLPEPLVKFPRWKTAVYWGKMTFSLYLLHPIARRIADILIPDRFDYPKGSPVTEALLGLVFVFGLAYLSYHYLEMPFLQLKKRFTVVKSRDGH